MSIGDHFQKPCKSTATNQTINHLKRKSINIYKESKENHSRGRRAWAPCATACQRPQPGAVRCCCLGWCRRQPRPCWRGCGCQLPRWRWRARPAFGRRLRCCTVELLPHAGCGGGGGGGHSSMLAGQRRAQDRRRPPLLLLRCRRRRLRMLRSCSCRRGCLL